MPEFYLCIRHEGIVRLFSLAEDVPAGAEQVYSFIMDGEKPLSLAG